MSKFVYIFGFSLKIYPVQAYEGIKKEASYTVKYGCPEIKTLSDVFGPLVTSGLSGCVQPHSDR